jgi:hypothetical protein
MKSLTWFSIVCSGIPGSTYSLWVSLPFFLMPLTRSAAGAVHGACKGNRYGRFVGMAGVQFFAAHRFPGEILIGGVYVEAHQRGSGYM